MDQFRCTYCTQVIPWRIDSKELGLAPDEELETGKLYPYTKCYCGWGKFVRYDAGDKDSTSPKNSLIAVPSPGTMVRERVEDAKYMKIPLDRIKPNPYQPRRFFDQKSLQSLAESITQVGLLEDVLVRPKYDYFELVLGERRWRAAQLAGCESISAKVVEMDDEESRKISIVENIQRENLTDVEEAFAFKKYVDAGLEQRDVGQQMGNMADRVAAKLKILSSHYYVQYQEQRIKDLGDEIERLREQATKGRNGFHSVLVTGEELLPYLDDGYDVVVVLDKDRIVVRRWRERANGR